MSDWIKVDQAAIDRFAETAGDRQWIHTDPARAGRESPFGGTVAHGFLTLAPRPRVMTQVLELPAGSQARGRFALAECEPLPGGVQLRRQVTVERDTAEAGAGASRRWPPNGAPGATTDGIPMRIHGFISRLSRPARGLAAAAAVLALAACSTLQFAYNNAEGLVRYMAYDYLDLDDAQDAEFRRRVTRFLDWHRARELPLYVHAAGEMGQRVARGLREADIVWAIGEARARYRASAARAAEELAPLLVTLTEAQIVDLEKRLERANRKFEREFVIGDEARLRRERARRMIGRFEDFSGRLNATQRARIERFVRETPASGTIRLAERRRWQREAVALLRKHRDARSLTPELARLFSDPEHGQPAEYLRETRRWEADLGRLIAELDLTLSNEQRGRMVTRIARYGEDFRALAGAVPTLPAVATPSASGPHPTF